MDPGLFALLGAVCGALVTGLLTWFSSSNTSRREERAERQTLNLELCTQFLTAIDAEIRKIAATVERHGALPGDMGQYFRSQTHHDLTALELRCPGTVIEAAEKLVRALESWADGPGTVQQLTDCRAEYVRTIQTRL